MRVTWLGQAGVAVESTRGRVCLIDPYLSDALAASDGLTRAIPSPLDPATTRADVVVTTHWHPDHLDRATCLPLWNANPNVLFVGPPANGARLAGWGIPHDRIRDVGRGDEVTTGPFKIAAGFARHDVPGWICEDAISVVVEIDGRRVFHTGDTEYDNRLLMARRRGSVDVGFFVMNGTGGNMTALEAAVLAVQLDPEVAVPMHFGMWAPSGYSPERAMPWTAPTLDPDAFLSAYGRLGGRRAVIPRVGVPIER